ncbi:hypothetical protein BKA70DRAFT_1400890 [Coprinopsis sp. MPI-PUGE-AT-0042]|nr:hypothetical protein BKA70DRAFT_1400890 [Coprinopsis sp. MPI-PUGE-AT-0042]
MQFKTSVLTFFVALCSTQLSSAAPSLEARSVFVPPVIKPDSTDTWVIGTTESVVWDVSNPPAQISNKEGLIVLRNVKTELLELDHPLAQGFNILLGTIDVTVPAVTPGTYQAVVIGNSGNWGQPFEIVAA